MQNFTETMKKKKSQINHRGLRPQPKGRKKWQKKFCLKSIVMNWFTGAVQNILAKKTRS